MKTIGEFLKQARLEKKYSKTHLEKKTKIKKEFITSIEDEIWGKLPAFPVVLGFVKNIAGALDLDQKQATALLKRDYPPQKADINPKPDVDSKFTWTPKMTFVAGIVVVFVLILGYLGFQYSYFVKPPKLEVSRPQEGQEIVEKVITVEGKTNPNATVTINNQPALVTEKGEFSAQIEIFSGTKEIIVKAISRSGKEKVVVRTIEPKL